MTNSPFASIKGLIAALVVTGGLTGTSSEAGTLKFSYSYTAAGIASAGFLTTTDTLVGGAYTILAMQGLRNDQAISGLLPPSGFAFNDNLLKPAGTHLTGGGASYTAGGINYNIYTNDFGFSPCDDLQNWETTTGFCGTQVPISLNIQPFTPAANTLYFAFTYTGTGIATAGILATTNTLVGGTYTINGIEGQRNGVDISGLQPPGGFAFNDNKLKPGSPYLTGGGASYTAGGINYNFYTNDFGFPPCDDLLNWETTTGFCGTQVPVVLTIQQLDAVPEPATMTLLGTGLAAAAVRRRRVRLARQR